MGRYAEAAARVVEAGYRTPSLSYTALMGISRWRLSPLWNHRQDEYGGSFGKNRAVVCAYVSARHQVQPSRHESPWVAVSQPRKTLMVACGSRTASGTRRRREQGVRRLTLSVSTGIYETFTRISPTMDFPPGWLLATAAAIKKAVRVPVIGVSRIHSTRHSGTAATVRVARLDLVAFGRALLTDPELPNKARDGRQDEIISCIGCNQGCVDRISRQLDVTCLVNPRVGREPGFEVTISPAAPRVVVAGVGNFQQNVKSPAPAPSAARPPRPDSRLIGTDRPGAAHWFSRPNCLSDLAGRFTLNSRNEGCWRLVWMSGLVSPLTSRR